MVDARHIEVAKGVRLEVDDSNGDVYIVFRITNEQFKQKIRGNWEDDIEFKVVNKTLVLKE